MPRDKIITVISLQNELNLGIKESKKSDMMIITTLIYDNSALSVIICNIQFN